MQLNDHKIYSDAGKEKQLSERKIALLLLFTPGLWWILRIPTRAEKLERIRKIQESF